MRSATAFAFDEYLCFMGFAIHGQRAYRRGHSRIRDGEVQSRCHANGETLCEICLLNLKYKRHRHNTRHHRSFRVGVLVKPLGSSVICLNLSSLNSQ